MRVLDYLISPSRVWAMEEGAWQEMVNIVSRERVSIEAIEAKLGHKLDNKQTNSVSNENGVAVIPVIGPIVRYGNIFSEVSGSTSVTNLTSRIEEALADDSVKSILFNIDSPGGEANGISELSEMIYNARGIKPMETYISGLGCSAAYWIASATDKIWINDIAMAGSIGVASVVEDSTQKKENEGTKIYKFVSDGAENKRPDLETEEGQQVVKKSLNAISKVFRSRVARNRSNSLMTLSSEDVIDKFGKGGTFIGEDAVRVGLVDGLSSYQTVLENLQKENIMADNKVNGAEKGSLDNVAIEVLKGQVTSLESTNSDLDATISRLETSNTELSNQLQEVTEALSSLVGERDGLVAKISRLEESNLKLEAISIADSLNEKMIPAKRDSFIADYILRAKDDKTSPVEGTSRVDSLVSMWKGVDNHGLTEEALTPETMDLSNVKDDKEDLNSQALAELLEQAKAFASSNNKTVAQR